MKQSLVKKIFLAAFATVVTAGLLVGCGEDTPSDIVRDYAPASANNVGTPGTDASGGEDTQGTGYGGDGGTGYATDHEGPIFNAPHVANVTVIDIAFDTTPILSQAMTLDSAAQVGAQYIYDIFGRDITGMYVELEFSNWDHMTRPLWHGSVSANNRNTLHRRNRSSELHEEFFARYDLGEDREAIIQDLEGFMYYTAYHPADFYFVIDAITGKRIDIWISLPHMRGGLTIEQSDALSEYIEREWDGDWSAAHEIELSQQEMDELRQLAEAAAQRHFEGTTVVSIDQGTASTNFIYQGNGIFDREASAFFTATDETGRDAMVTVHNNTRQVIGVSTMGNDFDDSAFEVMDIEDGGRRPHYDDASEDEYAGG